MAQLRRIILMREFGPSQVIRGKLRLPLLGKVKKKGPLFV